MKKIMLVGLLLAVGSIARAEYANNPDRRPSIGFNFGTQSTDGTSTAKDMFGYSASQDVDFRSNGIFVDARVPVSDNLTLNFNIGRVTHKSTYETTPILFGGETKSDGFDLGIGFRVYLK